MEMFEQVQARKRDRMQLQNEQEQQRLEHHAKGSIHDCRSRRHRCIIGRPAVKLEALKQLAELRKADVAGQKDVQRRLTTRSEGFSMEPKAPGSTSPIRCRSGTTPSVPRRATSSSIRGVKPSTAACAKHPLTPKSTRGSTVSRRDARPFSAEIANPSFERNEGPEKSRTVPSTSGNLWAPPFPKPLRV